MKILFFLLLIGGGGFLGAQNTPFYLQNQENDAVFYYWVIKADHLLNGKETIQELPKARTGRQCLAPGEKRAVDMGPDELLVAVFLPWKEDLDFRTPLKGGFLRNTEVPAGKTVLISRANFLAFNAARGFSASLQDLEIPVPQFVLDGQLSDWAKVTPLAEFAPDFHPLFQGIRNGSLVKDPFPSGVPSPVPFTKIRGAWFDRGLWLAFQCAADLGPTLGWAVNLRYGAAKGVTKIIEIPLNQEQTEVRLWSSDQPLSRDIGRAWHRGPALEVWIPSGRLTQAETEELRRASVDFSQVVEFNETTWDLYYTSYSLQELP